MSKQLSFGHAFTPKENKPITLDRTTIYCYPPIKEEMSDAEKTYAYMVTKSALETAESVSIEAKVQSFGELMSCPALTGILMARFANAALNKIRQVGNFEVLSYHGRNGSIIADCTVQGGNLKECEGVTLANRRPGGINYAKLCVDLDFSDIDPLCTTIQPFTFYVRFQQEDRTVTTDVAGMNIRLHTFHGPSNWQSTQSQDDLDAIWDNPRGIGKPFTLYPPSIMDVRADAVVVIEQCVQQLKKYAYKAMWPAVSSDMLKQLCPNMQDDPTLIIQDIHMQSRDSTDEVITLTCAQYFKAISNMTQFLSKIDPWPIDVVQHHNTHLIEGIRNQTKSNGYHYNPSSATRLPWDQTRDLGLAYKASSQAERDINLRKVEITDQLKSNHALMTTVSVHQSQAEGTLKKYIRSCWGCGEPNHAYCDKKGNIICPNKDKPGVAQRAADKRAEYQARYNKRNKERSEKRKIANLLTGLTEDQVRSLVSNIKRKTENNGDEDNSKKVWTFLTCVCFSSDLQSKPLLPINIETNIPHISLPIGSPTMITKLFLPVIYDTAAVLCVGAADYHLALANKYPEIVKSLVWAKDNYTPLTLSGVVNDNTKQDKSKEKLVTLLKAVIEYNMPIKTTQGHATSFKVALGEGVGVNTIMGMSMIRPGKFTLDVEDDVVTSGVLDCSPFPVTYKSVQRTMPNFDNSDRNSTVLSTVNKNNENVKELVKSCIKDTFFKPVELVKDSKSNELSPVLAAAQHEERNNKPLKKPIEIMKRPKYKSTKKKSVTYFQDHLRTKEDDTPFSYIYDNKLGSTLRKIKLPKDHVFPPPNKAFEYVYNKSKDEKEFHKNLVLDKDTPERLRVRVQHFVREFWDVFREGGVNIPVSGYEMDIDTGSHPPIAVKNPRYGLHESVIMNKTIEMLYDLGFIVKDVLSPWGFRITLAPKPHQDEVTDIADYVWRFCINYILLNKVTRSASYPIPRCDDAVMYGFGTATCFILFDAYSGYHQIKLTEEASLKTAFYAPQGRKYRFVVMPFGPKNAPVAYVAMAHDLQEIWRDLAIKEGIGIDENEGTTIIIDDTLLFSISEDNMFVLARCVCIVARKYCLTWKLKKCRWFPQELEFVGVDVSKYGNSPAKSKFELLKRWKQPTTARAVMGFIGFTMFYMRWIAYFELKITPLRDLIRGRDLDANFAKNVFNKQCRDCFKYISDKILSKPILQRADINKRFYLKTDFSSFGLGYALCQPDSSPEALAAMKREDDGGDCEFETLAGCVLRLLLVALGSRRTVGNEKYLHSHPGEALAAIFGIHKNRPFLWGRPFTLITDCRALLWLMSYKGTNAPVRRLQLEMQGYFFTIAHRTRDMLEDANYMSYLADDITLDPLLNDYLSFARQMYVKHPPAEGEVNKDNMPGRRKKRTSEEISCEEESANVNANFASVILNEDDPVNGSPECNIFNDFDNVPVVFASRIETNKIDTHKYSYILQAADRISSFSWCVFEPQFGHFLQTTREESINFNVVIATESKPFCRSLLQEYWKVPIIHPSIGNLIQYLTLSTQQPKIQGYYAIITNTSHAHIRKQCILIDMLQTGSALQLFILEIREPLHNKTYEYFEREVTKHGWKLSSQLIYYNEHSDLVYGDVKIITGTRRDKTSPDTQLCTDIKASPMQPVQFNAIIEQTFNNRKYAVPYIGQHFKEVWSHNKKFRQPSTKLWLKVLGVENQSEEGYSVFDEDYPAPLPTENKQGLFGQLFGILFHDDDGNQHIRTISIYEYSKIYGYDSNFVSQITRSDAIEDTLLITTPRRTMSAVLNMAHNVLNIILQTIISNENTRLDMDLSAPALLNGVVPTTLPDDSIWTNSYNADKECKMMIDMIKNPSLIVQDNLNKIPYIFRQPMRMSQIKWDQDKLCYFEPISYSTRSVRLVLVPNQLRRLICVAFHVNPLGGHYSVYYTHHRVRLRFIWLGMYKFIADFIKSCAACISATSAARPRSELLYSFPLAAPFHTIHADCWEPGRTESFDGAVALMIVLDHLTGFAAIEELRVKNATSFAAAIYKILLRYGLAQLIVTDADSKFKGEFKKVAEILKIQHHQVSRGNHDPVLVERFNRMLNSALRIFTSDRASTRVFLEGALMTAYAWNSAPVAGTNLSRSLVVVGREFEFPIDFTTRQHLTFSTNPAVTQTYAENMLNLLEKSREVYKVLIEEHRAYHRELRNSQLNQTTKFQVDDIVFTRVQVQSNVSKGQVKKLRYVTRGPYIIMASTKSGSYELVLNNKKSTTIIKKHGSEIFKSPRYISPHQHLDSSDHIFGSMQKPVVQHPYELASIKGFEHVKPWATSAALAVTEPEITIFPTVEELDNEIDAWPVPNPFNLDDRNPCSDSNKAGAKGHPISGDADHITNFPSLNAAVVPKQIHTISNEMIRSEDKLYFISYTMPNTTRKEWRLVRINLDLSMIKHSKCLQDGRFIAEFYTQHVRDDTLDWTSKRFWLEYHKSDRVKRLSQQYYLLPPTDISVKQASLKNLVPYREYIQFGDPSVLIHGPFEFAKLNGRKTRDRISANDWNILRSERAKYDDSPPIFRNNLVNINFDSEYIVEHRTTMTSNIVTSFLGRMEVDDLSLHDYEM